MLQAMSFIHYCSERIRDATKFWKFVNKDNRDQNMLQKSGSRLLTKEDEHESPLMHFSFMQLKLVRIKRHLNLSNIKQMDDTFWKHLTNCVLNDSDVLFQWCMAGQDESGEDAQDCLEKWKTIREYSFASSMMEM